MMNERRVVGLIVTLLLLAGCGQNSEPMADREMIRMMTVAPGHFHAALVQKNMYPGVDSMVYVFAEEGPELDDYLSRIEAYNNRAEEPTGWKKSVYRGDDFFQKMLQEKPGNLVMLAGNNQHKTRYIFDCVENGLHVLADKPMVIRPEDFDLLKSAFEKADSNGVLLYDMMTERFEITTQLQRIFSQQREIFGTLIAGTPDEPAITKESVHHFSKVISGIPLLRPPWFFDTDQQGEAIADVGTHLVDLIQWEAFPDQVIQYETDVEIIDSRQWDTPLTMEQFGRLTGLDEIPGYLKKYVTGDEMHIPSNSSLLYILKGVYANVSVEWKYEAPAGAGDTHYSLMRGTLTDLIIRQGPEEMYQPTLYIRARDIQNADLLAAKIDLFSGEGLQQNYPGMAVEQLEKGYWRVSVPKKYRVGHEAHFAQVTEQFLEYMAQGKIPETEVANMLAKYYTTTAAVAAAAR